MTPEFRKLLKKHPGPWRVWRDQVIVDANGMYLMSAATTKTCRAIVSLTKPKKVRRGKR